MQRSSESIGAIAAALAKAQSGQPGKVAHGHYSRLYPRESDQTFRYAALSAGLDIVRKSLGGHEIATVQTTSIDKEAGWIRLTTVLAHSSGEWLSSEWTGLRDQRDGDAAPDGGGADLRPSICPLYPGRHRGRRRSGRARPRSRRENCRRPSVQKWKWRRARGCADGADSEVADIRRQSAAAG